MEDSIHSMLILLQQLQARLDSKKLPNIHPDFYIALLERFGKLLGELSKWPIAENAVMQPERASLAKYAPELFSCASGVVSGATAAGPWCRVCHGLARREDGRVATVSDIQHQPDCPVWLACELSGYRGPKPVFAE